jgi:cytoskeletal protein CcmA (bactofilin family)
MKRKRVLLVALGVVALLGGSSGAAAKGGQAPTVMRGLHIQRKLRVDGSSDLRGVVTARSGLHVTAGLKTDTLQVSGPAFLSGILRVAGAATVGGLNAGSASIVTTGALQGGSLSLSGDATLAGNLSVAKTLVASGGLQAGPISAASISTGGSLSAGSISTSGSIISNGTVSGNSGSFSQLSVSPGGTVNFNNATVNGLNFSGGAGAFSSLQITNLAAGGNGGTQALTISQAGKTSSLSVDSSGALTVGGAGLSAPSLEVANSATVGGTLTTSKVAATGTLTLSAPSVSTTGDLAVGSGGNLVLSNTGSGTAPHLLGNHDTRGRCSTSVSAAGSGTCGVTFTEPYASTPIVVATPTGSNPGFITGFSVQATTSGFTIYFTTSDQGTATFTYIVQG